MLDYVLRIRDLVHGTILFTKQETALINHPFFQRLRQIRQNDVAFHVYPSMNTSRFEHVLGVCRIAGMMAETLTESPRWEEYVEALRRETKISLKEDFVRLCRFYALLHDIGHFPLSHLFEHAVKEWLGNNKEEYTRKIEEWTGSRGFGELHEAFGASLAGKIISDVRIKKEMGDALMRLMAEKNLPFQNPLYVVKSVIDAQIDADRIDSIQRDGIAAGGEYGHYDVRRLCDSAFIECDEVGWVVAYSEKALTSLEALLLDRYRVYTWIHFHHRVIAMKMLVSYLIQKTLELGLIKKEHFDYQIVREFLLKDDVWLWDILRNMEPDNKLTKDIKKAVFFRNKTNILNLWKGRPIYQEFQERITTERYYPEIFEVTKPYENYLNEKMKVHVLTFKPEFKVLGKKQTYLYSETSSKITSTLLQASEIVGSLTNIWNKEPRYFVLLVGNKAKIRARKLSERWIDLTKDWILASLS